MGTIAVQEVGEALQLRAPELLGFTGTPGGAVALTDKAGALFEFAAGTAGGRTLTPRDVMNVGSVAKPYVAACVFVLAEMGMVALDAPVSAYLPFALVNPVGGPAVTLRHLLTHTAGFATDTFDASWTRETRYYERELEAGRTHEYDGVRFRWADRAGERYIYSSFGVGLAGRAVAHVLGKPFGQCVHDLILGPLGMQETAWPDGPGWDDIAARRVPGHLRVGPTTFTAPMVTSGSPEACELVTSPADHLRFLRALWNAGETGDGGRVLSRDSVTALLSPQVKNILFGLDLGWMGHSVQFRNNGQPDFFWGHGGGFPFQGWAESRVYPDLGFAGAAFDRKWEVYRHIDPPDAVFAGIVLDWAARWMRNGAVPPNRLSLANAWPYAVGLIVGERYVGSLGLHIVTDEALHALVKGRVTEDDARFEDWDEGQFREGVHAMERTGGDPERIAAVLDDPASPVGREEMEMLSLAWGAARPTDMVLVRGLADRSGVPAQLQHLAPYDRSAR